MPKTNQSTFTAISIGERLRLTRQALGLRQNQFCERAGIEATAYNQNENGKKRPSIETSIALCDTYALTLDWIFRDEPSGLPYALADAIKKLREARAQAQ